jgi:hypothetical protein
MKIGGLTLTYPAGFFDAVRPSDNTVGSTSVQSMTATSSTPTATTGTRIIFTTANSIIITTTTTTIPKSTAFTITLSGLKTGPFAVAATFSSTTSIDLVAAEFAAPALGIISPGAKSIAYVPSSSQLPVSLIVGGFIALVIIVLVIKYAHVFIEKCKTTKRNMSKATNNEKRLLMNDFSIIPWNELEFESHFAPVSGNFGDVRKALWNGIPVAVKTLR